MTKEHEGDSPVATVEMMEKVAEYYSAYKGRSFFKDKEKVEASDLFFEHIDNPLHFVAVMCPGYLYVEHKRDGTFDCLEPWQVDFLYATYDVLRQGKKGIKKACCGGKSSGKSFIAALEVLWLMWRYRGQSGIFKAFSGKEDQIKSVLFGTMARIVADRKNTFLRHIYHEKPVGLKFYTKTDVSDAAPRRIRDEFFEACTWNKSNPDALSGDHAPVNVYILDEAQAIDDIIFPYLQGIFSTHIAYLIMTGNGTKPEGIFARTIQGDEYFTKQIDLDDCVRSTINYEDIKRSYEAYGEQYTNIFYHGAIGTGTKDGFFNITDCERAIAQGKQPRDPRQTVFGGVRRSIVGVDLAYGVGNDATVMVRLKDFQMDIIFYSKDEPLENVVTLLTIESQRQAILVLDGDGPGTDVALRLANLRPSVSSHLVRNKAKTMNKAYFNLKSVCYAKFRAWLSDGRTSIRTNLGEDVLNELRKQFSSIKFEFKDGQMLVADKTKMTVSPDITDAAAYAFFMYEETTLNVGF